MRGAEERGRGEQYGLVVEKVIEGGEERREGPRDEDRKGVQD